ncbi:hypothetical protein BU25DRAFT_453279 [Macroventuria anomochaeta]|uniref:Uncharacterized protein n=1 Tax=Macroventuria anomochaeta TaxID=301207 RepID=A0ACB6SH07_9PLEO|nr:uncharacterized protein BU25DRAFT_453279 [Macroventuria anomochaeta]KAF2633526.1 hypothetical protein BU25DRAFT_453279 [Macroventuria anomochaeta]
MTPSRPSPFADQPFDIAVAGTESMIEEWLQARKVDDTSKLIIPQMKPWYYGCIGGVPIPTLTRRLWTSTRDGVRTNRYGLPAHFYAILWMALLLAALGLFVMAIPEGLEMARDRLDVRPPNDYLGPSCGDLPTDRFYRIVYRNIVNSLPLLVSLTIFFFPALVKS